MFWVFYYISICICRFQIKKSLQCYSDGRIYCIEEWCMMWILGINVQCWVKLELVNNVQIDDWNNDFLYGNVIDLFGNVCIIKVSYGINLQHFDGCKINLYW